jgi:2-iminoacetate synthase ThiH
VDELINICIAHHLDKRSFNNKNDIISALISLGVDPKNYATYYENIDAAIKRRHKIVHESDRSAHASDSHGKLVGLSVKGVTAWVNAVDDFGIDLVTEFKARG